MATNADSDDDSKKVTEDDLRNLKYGQDGVEDSKETDESEEAEETEESEETSDEDGQTADEATEDETSDEFVKEFPYIKGDTPEEYARNLEKAYGNSFAELKRIREAAKQNTDERVGDTKQEVDLSDPLALYAKQKMDEEINQEFANFSKQYPQVTDPAEYSKFTVEVATLSNTILNSQKRLASPKELYSKAAVILGWETDQVSGKDKLNAALKDSASVSRSNSATKKPVKSKVTDQMIAVNRLMYPNKTDAQIRQELEAYVK